MSYKIASYPDGEGTQVNEVRGILMKSGLTELDFIEELRLRRWAREHYVPCDKRLNDWHPVVLEEMARKDHDITDSLPAPTYAWTAN